MTTRRTTLAADHDDLATIEAEDLRRRRPRVGIARSGTGLAAASAADEHAPARRLWQSC